MGTADQWEVGHDGLPEHRAQLLEGRGGPPGAHRRHGQVHRPALRRHLSGSFAKLGAVPGRRLRGLRPTPTRSTFHARARRRSTRPARGTSRSSSSQADFEHGRLPAAGARTPATPATSATTPTSRIGMNAATPNAEAARTFLSWVASGEFAELYANALPGFFSLSNSRVTLEDPLAAGVRRPGARRASRPSATRTRSSRAASRTSRTSCGASRRRSSTARLTPGDAAARDPGRPRKLVQAGRQ